MNFEMFRLGTFLNWPKNAPITKDRLAKGGFYYKNESLKVQCFCCHTIFDDWEYGDQVMTRHRDKTPNCPFVLNPENTRNVPYTLVNPDTLKEESVRLLTFRDWPYENIIKANDLAQSGFYYLNVGDQTKCAFCLGTCGAWRQGDIPQLWHKELFPFCQMVEICMESEEIRKMTFSKWPKTDVIDPSLLAKAGFYYLNKGDDTKCFRCGGVATNWKAGDNPDEEHRNIFPNCKYVKDVIIPRLPQEPTRIVEENQTNELGQMNAPIYEEYINYDDRLRTFGQWFVSHEQTAEELAEAGFFYGGRGDLVKCFYCNGGLQQWHQDDIPWVEHAKWFQNCDFVKRNKSEKFILNCLSRRGAESSISPFWDSKETVEALALDIDPKLVRSAIKNYVKEHGISFSSSEELVAAALENLPEVQQEAAVAKGGPVAETKESVKLAEENRALREARLCKICMDAELNIVFLPCAHFATCGNCSGLVNECPICRKAIQNRLKTFLP